ncbi:MerR family transcriptional regulator [Streptococcus himalayensis]|uniref:MerR family transcriptional regulator n=1 Tax=Streptococcus himalayensis TaxID=1888195 RepID=A0A917A8U0_9STRE|nr:helix-turn-helix domain-containing protein [Streptococcus himalayensis]GGE34829.1 MerR family transcriptional regulator [Streptococcus himalayensis]
MKKILRIGEFSKINAISIRTLRFYDQIGLLHPYHIDPETNYRYYHIKQSSIVDSIQYLRQLDFSLEDIKEILSDKSNPHLHQLIEDRYHQLIKEKQILEERIKEIESFRSGVQLYQERRFQKELEIQAFPQRKVATFKLSQNIYQMSPEEYELNLRYFKQEINQYSPFFENFSKIGSLMDLENFQSQNWYSDCFLLFHDQYLDLPSLSTKQIPEGAYAIQYAASFEEEIRLLPHFYQAIQQAGYRTNGPYICEVIHEHPNLSHPQRDMFIRMQVRIAKIH